MRFFGAIALVLALVLQCHGASFTNSNSSMMAESLDQEGENRDTACTTLAECGANETCTAGYCKCGTSPGCPNTETCDDSANQCNCGINAGCTEPAVCESNECKCNGSPCVSPSQCFTKSDGAVACGCDGEECGVGENCVAGGSGNECKCGSNDPCDENETCVGGTCECETGTASSCGLTESCGLNDSGDPTCYDCFDKDCGVGETCTSAAAPGVCEEGCSPNCINGGTCDGSFACVCGGNFTGDHCQTCGSGPCQPGETCESSGSGLGSTLACACGSAPCSNTEHCVDDGAGNKSCEPYCPGGCQGAAVCTATQGGNVCDCDGNGPCPPGKKCETNATTGATQCVNNCCREMRDAMIWRYLTGQPYDF